MARSLRIHLALLGLGWILAATPLWAGGRSVRFLEGRPARWTQAGPGFDELVMTGESGRLRVELAGPQPRRLRWRGCLGGGPVAVHLQVASGPGLEGLLAPEGGALVGEGGLRLAFEPLGPALPEGRTGFFVVDLPATLRRRAGLKLTLGCRGGWMGWERRGPLRGPSLQVTPLALAFRDGSRGVMVEGDGLQRPVHVDAPGVKLDLAPAPGGRLRQVVALKGRRARLRLRTGRLVKVFPLRLGPVAPRTWPVLAPGSGHPLLARVGPGSSPAAMDRAAGLLGKTEPRILHPEQVGTGLVRAFARHGCQGLLTGPWASSGPVMEGTPAWFAGRAFRWRDAGSGRELPVWAALPLEASPAGAAEGVRRMPEGPCLVSATPSEVEAWNARIASPRLALLKADEAPVWPAAQATLVPVDPPATPEPEVLALLSRLEGLWALHPTRPMPVASLFNLWNRALVEDRPQWQAEVLREVRTLLLEVQPAPSSGAVEVVNLLGWTRSGWVRIPAHLSQRGDRVRNLMGRPVPSRREADGSLSAWAGAVPPFGPLRLRLEEGSAFEPTEAVAEMAPVDPLRGRLEAACPLVVTTADAARQVAPPLLGHLPDSALLVHALRSEGAPGLWRLTLVNPGDEEMHLNLQEAARRVSLVRLDGPGSLDVRYLRVGIPARTCTDLVLRLVPAR